MGTAQLLLSTKEAAASLGTLISPVDKNRFQSSVRRLHSMFTVYADTSPEPLPAPGLIVTPEIRVQCERYQPIAEVAAAFNRLYAAALTFPPILSSTPFHNALSWADTFSALPPEFQISADPGRLLEALLDDGRLLTRFLFASFLPVRFYGGIGRYPEQRKFIAELLAPRKKGTTLCLDAACGTGEDTYGLALLLKSTGFSSENLLISGWTVEPLEVWAAARRCFPHDRSRETVLREATSPLFRSGFDRCISFRCQDILATSLPETGPFDLILCNGLLGGPIIHEKTLLELAVKNLARLLAPGGVLLAADNFHGGWKQKCPQTKLRALFEGHQLKTFEAGEGIGGLKSD